MKRVLEIKFNNCTTKVELLDTPAVEKWVNIYTRYAKEFLLKGIPISHKVEEAKAFIHTAPRNIGHKFVTKEAQERNKFHSALNVTEDYCVDKINESIAEANSVISGIKFPYPAFYGMSWNQTNLIHRCFTTAAITFGYWVHNLSHQQLLEYKKRAYQRKNIQHFINLNNYKPQYKVHDKEKFINAIERVNKYVHYYESFNGNTRSRNFKEEIGGQGQYISIDWDSHDPDSGHHLFWFGDKITYDELKASFPDNYHDYDVFLGKSITGKDYEFAFCEYDNGLEWDITNLDFINGSLRIHFSDEIKKAYNNSSFTKWCKEYDLEEPMYLPIPIGKIIENNCDFNSLKPNVESKERYSNGAAKPYPPFDKASVKIVVS